MRIWEQVFGLAVKAFIPYLGTQIQHPALPDPSHLLMMTLAGSCNPQLSSCYPHGRETWNEFPDLG